MRIFLPPPFPIKLLRWINALLMVAFLATAADAASFTTETVSGRDQKIPRITLSATETDYQISASTLPHLTCTLQLSFSVASYYHSIIGSAAADGYPIAAGATLTLTLVDGQQFGLCTATGAGTVDIVVLATP
jgi:hypothetical protein